MIIILTLLSVATAFFFAIIEKKYKNFSYISAPYSIGISILITYYIPAIINKDLNKSFDILIEVFLFYVIFLIFYVILRINDKKYQFEEYKTPKKLYKIYLVTIFIWLISIYAGLEDKSLMTDRALNPRDYTFIRQGQGVITFISISLTFFATFYSSCEFIRKKNISNFIFLLVFLSVNLLGGGKSSMVVPIIIFAAAHERVRGFIKMKDLLKYSIIAAILFIISFGFYTRVGSRSIVPLELIERINSYQQELAISDALFDNANSRAGDYFTHGILGTFQAPIPRAFYSNKDSGALYLEYVNPLLKISEDQNHFATYGIQLEGKLVFGFIWPLISALIMIILILYTRIFSYNYETKYLYNLWIVICTFGLIRAGMLYTTPWMILLIVPLISIYGFYEYKKIKRIN